MSSAACLARALAIFQYTMLFLRHLLASGSADNTVIIWDLDKLEIAKRIDRFTGKVQSIKWRPTDYQTLLTGDCDK